MVKGSKSTPETVRPASAGFWRSCGAVWVLCQTLPALLVLVLGLGLEQTEIHYLMASTADAVVSAVSRLWRMVPATVLFIVGLDTVALIFASLLVGGRNVKPMLKEWTAAREALMESPLCMAFCWSGSTAAALLYVLFYCSTERDGATFFSNAIANSFKNAGDLVISIVSFWSWILGLVALVAITTFVVCRFAFPYVFFFVSVIPVACRVKRYANRGR